MPTDDYSNGPDTSGWLNTGSSVTGNIETAFDMDTFRVFLTGGKTYTIDLEGYPTNAGTLSDPYLYSLSNGLQLIGFGDDDSGIGSNSQLKFTPIYSGDYYITAGAYHNEIGTYKLSIDNGTGSNDEDRPGVPVLAFANPSHNTQNISVSSNIELTFSENIRAGSGNITLFNLTKNAGIDIPITNTNVVTFSGNKMTINPAANISAGCEFEVRFGSGVVVDTVGNAFFGLGSRDLRFTTAGKTPTEVNIPIRLETLPGENGYLSQGYNTNFTHKLYLPTYDSRWSVDFATIGNALAVADGVVETILPLTYMSKNEYLAEGNNITIRHEVDHDNNSNTPDKIFYATYAHLSSFGTIIGTDGTPRQLRVGDRIEEGYKLGVIGGSGNGNGSHFGIHLHFQSSSGTGNHGMANASTFEPLIYFSDLLSSVDNVPNDVINGTRLRSTDIIGTTATGTGTSTEKLIGTNSGERIFGLEGNDKLQGNGGNDEICGGRGNDTLEGGEGDDLLVGGTGNDIINGGNGIDTVSYNSSTAYININMANTLSQNTNGSGIDSLSNIENLTGSNYNDNLTGNEIDNVIKGGSGNDIIKGGAGNDILSGDYGKDTLTGGAGADRFEYNVIYESGADFRLMDIITDFKTSESDKIDLSTIDANSATSNVNDSFIFIINSAFTGIGQVRFASGVLYGNTDSNYSTSEFAIQLTGVTTLAASDIIL